MLAFCKTNKDDLLAIWSQTTVRCALQVEKDSNRPGARVVGFGTGETFWGDAYAAETKRLWNASAIW